MKNCLNVVWAAFAVAGGLLSAAASIAADAEPEVMVVSASRTEIDLTKVASSVTVIDRDFIDQRQSVYVVDLLRGVPGLTVNTSGSAGGYTEVRSRGGEANQLLVLVDGVRGNDPASFDLYQWQYLTSNDIERIEIVRGPQSAIWGSDANSGVVNIITRRAGDPLAGGGYLEGGSYDSTSAGLRVGGKNAKFGWGFNGSYVGQDGFNNAQTGDEDDPFNNKTAGINLSYTPAENSRLGLVLRYTEAETDTDGQTCTPTPGDDPCAQVVTDSNDSTDSRQLIGGLTGEIGFINNRWIHQVAFNGTSTKNEFASEIFGSSDSEGSITEVTYQTSWDFARNGVVAGTDLVTFAIDSQNRGYKNSFGIDDDTRLTGYVLEGRTLVAEALSLTGSVRYDDNSDYKDAATWRITAGYDFADTGTRLRGAAGTGQKAPTATELYGFSPASGFVGNPDLKPEKSEGWELGIDQKFLDEAYLISLTYFNEDLTDQIVTVFLPDFSSTVDNAPGTTRRKGVEAALTGYFTEGFTGRLSYTYLDSDAVVLAGTSVIGRAPEIRRPRNTLGLNLNYSFLASRANLNLNVYYSDEQLDNVFFSDFSSSRTELENYTLVDLTGEYRFTDGIAVYARVNNLFDEEYEEVFSYNTMGRAGYMGLRVSFD